MHETAGRILHRAACYDWLVWLMTRGRERAFRDRLLTLARVQAGDAVLDVGCGTGTLAIAAKKRVGRLGTVRGIDPSATMIARAKSKADRSGIEVLFEQAIVEALPFPDGRFDLVTSTVMLHHLPRDARQACASEMRRVVKPGGRVFVADFGPPSHQRGFIRHFHRHGYTRPEDLIALLTGVGLERIESGRVGPNSLHFVLARQPESKNG
jgi:ubiquinone/menaquinone biosynthesis C-methylase UbiE